MQTNTGPTTLGLVAFSGVVSTPIDISNYVNFGFTFRVDTTLIADTVFNFQSHPGTPADPCIPGAAVAIDTIAKCSDDSFVAGVQASVTIPAGTVAGTVVVCTIPCRPDRFVSVAAGSGNTASVTVVAVLHGPTL